MFSDMKGLFVKDATKRPISKVYINPRERVKK